MINEINSINRTFYIENIAKSAIMVDRDNLVTVAIDLIKNLSDKKLKEIMERFYEKVS